MKRALVTLGRLPKGLEVARALHELGYEVIIAEPWSWHLSRLSRSVKHSVRVHSPVSDLQRYHVDLLAVIKRYRVNLVVPVSEEVLGVAALRSHPLCTARIFAEPLEHLSRLHDKLAFQQWLSELGLPHPVTLPADSSQARAYLASHDAIIKPRLSSAGNGLRRLQPGDLDRPGEAVEPMLLQQFLPGDELSSFSVVDAGRVIGTVVYRGLIISGTVSVCFERLPDPPAEITEWIAAFAGAINHSGFISFDFRQDARGRYLPMECNPRTTSGVHFVEPQSLGQAITDPANAVELRLRPEKRLQMFYPALTETQATALRGGDWRALTSALFSCRDCTWQRNDPLPFALLPFTSWEILYRTVFHGKSFGEATTGDIGWYQHTPTSDR